MLTKELGKADAPPTRWRDYYALTKPGVVQLLGFTAIVGMFLGTSPPSMGPWDELIFGILGTRPGAGSGAGLNHVADQRLDAQMARTKNRPLPTGRVTERDALAFALALGLLGIAV